MADHTRRVVVFGAGASHGSRDPRPPLGAELHVYVRKYLCAAWNELGCLEEGAEFPTDRIRRELRARLDDTQSFETLVSKLIRAPREQLFLKKLNLLMAYALTPPVADDPRADGAFEETRDVYDRFLAATVHSPQELESATFVTFNYDCLLERAICRCLGPVPLQGEGRCLCKHVDCQLTDNSGGVEVLKPHGSINWVADILQGDGSIAEDEEIPVVATLSAGGVFEWKKIRAVVSPIGQGHEEIVIAHYAPEKRPQINPGTLSKIRDLARARIEEAGFITIIGLHLPADLVEDPFLYELLEAMKRVKATGQAQVDYINLDPSETQKARSSFGFNVLKKTFDEYVAQCQDESKPDKRRTPGALN
jgi:hypothetical protein